MNKLFLCLIGIDNNNIITNEMICDIMSQIYSYNIDCVLTNTDGDMAKFIRFKNWLLQHFNPLLVEYTLANKDKLLYKYWCGELARFGL